MTFLKRKLFLQVITFTLIWATSLTSHATYLSHSGANCQAANQAQANLMIWSKNGVENNAAIDLFVMCPVDYNPLDFGANGTLEIFTNMWVPSSYGAVGAPGPFCVVRLVNTQKGASTTNDVIVNKAGVLGMDTFSGVPGMSGSGINGYFKLEMIVQANNPQAHLLCLLPKNGGTLRSYLGLQS